MADTLRNSKDTLLRTNPRLLLRLTEQNNSLQPLIFLNLEKSFFFYLLFTGIIMLRSKAAKSNPGIVSHDYTSDKGGSAMKWTKKLLVLAGIFTLCLGFTLTAQAADRQFKKKTVIMKEGKSKILTLVNSDSLPEVAHYDKDTSLFSYTVQGNSKIKVNGPARRDRLYYRTQRRRLRILLPCDPAKEKSGAEDQRDEKGKDCRFLTKRYG